MSNNNKSSYSWTLIIMFLIIFWPIGLYLIVKKVSSDKDSVYSDYNRRIRNIENTISREFRTTKDITNHAKNIFNEEIDKKNKFDLSSSKMKNLGIVITVIGLIGFIVSRVNDDSSFFSLYFLTGGGLLIFKSIKLKKEAELVKQYFSIIINGNIRQLDKISYTTGKSYDIVYKEIKNLIDKDYLENAYIDESRREVVITNKYSNSFYSNEPKVVTCTCCGATNTIYGQGECEYCGSPLK